MSVLASTGGSDDPGPRVSIAFAVALALHLAALFALTYWHGEKNTAPGQSEITIDLAPPMDEVEAQSPAEQSQAAPPPSEMQAETPPDTQPVEPPTEMVQAQPPEAVDQAKPEEAAQERPPDEMAPEKPAETAQVEPDLQPIVSSSVQAEPLAAPPVVQARPVEQPKPIVKKPPPPKVVEKPRPVREVREKTRPPPPARSVAAARSSSRATSRENSTGAAAAASDPNAMGLWQSQIQAALRSRAHYPPGLQGTGITGVATVRFVLSRNGRVMAASLAGSSGNGALDSAALAATGSSLPPAPQGVTVAQQSFAVPVRFRGP